MIIYAIECILCIALLRFLLMKFLRNLYFDDDIFLNNPGYISILPLCFRRSNHHCLGYASSTPESVETRIFEISALSTGMSQVWRLVAHPRQWQPTLGDTNQKPKFILHYFISFTKMGNLTQVTNPGPAKRETVWPKVQIRWSRVNSQVLTACLEQSKPNSFVLIHSAILYICKQCCWK